MDDQTFGVTPTDERAFRTIRQGLDPSEQDKQALLLAVMAKCAAPSPATEPLPPQSAVTPTVGGTATAAAVQSALLAATVSAALAFWSGYNVGIHKNHTASATPPSTTSGSVASSLPGTAAPEGTSPAGNAIVHPPSPKAPTPDPGVALAARGPAAANARERSTGRTAGTPSQSEGPTPPAFYNELSYLQRAQSALSSGQPELALGLMETLDESSPRGALLTERRMTKVLALCALDRGEQARVIASQVLSQKSGAAYAPRIQSSCARSAVVDHSSDENRDR